MRSVSVNNLQTWTQLAMVVVVGSFLGGVFGFGMSHERTPVTTRQICELLGPGMVALRLELAGQALHERDLDALGGRLEWMVAGVLPSGLGSSRPTVELWDSISASPSRSCEEVRREISNIAALLVSRDGSR